MIYYETKILFVLFLTTTNTSYTIGTLLKNVV